MKLFKRKNKKTKSYNGKHSDRVNVSDDRIKRRFSPIWESKGNFREDEMIDYLQSMKAQRKVMIKYIEELHNFIDILLKELK